MPTEATPQFDPETIAVVSFDLDGTLLDSRTAWREGFRAPFAWLTKRYPALAGLGEAGEVHDRVYQRYLDEAHLAAGGGEWSVDYMRQGWRDLVARHAPSAATTDGNANADAAFARYEASWPPLLRLFEDATRVLDAVHARYPMVLLTNGNTAYQRMKIEMHDLAPWFAHVVVSEEVGLMKPDPAIFAHAIAPLGVAPASVIHIGDTPAHDVAGARAAGWRSAWVNRDGRVLEGAHVPDVEIATLSGILEVLGLR